MAVTVVGAAVSVLGAAVMIMLGVTGPGSVKDETRVQLEVLCILAANPQYFFQASEDCLVNERMVECSLRCCRAVLPQFVHWVPQCNGFRAFRLTELAQAHP